MDKGYRLKYNVVQDDSGHDYLIPAHKKLDWYNWLEEDMAKEFRDGDVPEYAKAIDGIPDFYLE